MTSSPVTVNTTIDLLAAYRQMLTIRRFEEKAVALRNEDRLVGSIHPCGGQEAVPTGALSAIEDEDRVIATYRGHGWAIACGIPLFELFAELAGSELGINRGRAGSAYLSDPSRRFLGENSIVGAGLPVANGVAMAAKLQSTERIVVVTFGEGATSQGAAHEALVMAAARKLPVVFVCENNAWSEMTPISAITSASLTARVSGYGIRAATVDGNDPGAVATAVAEAAASARRGEGPTFLECETVRMMAHYHADVEHYRGAAEREASFAADPLPRLRQVLLDSQLSSNEHLVGVEEEVARDVHEAAERALHAPSADASTALLHVSADAPPPSTPSEIGEATELTVAGAINEALRRELADRPEVLLFGEDVAVPGGVFGVTRRLLREFGPERVFDTPIAESAILGAAVGAAQEGLRPIVEVMYSDFLLVALDQLVNQAANVRYLHSGARSAPMVVRCQQGATPGSCAQHSQSLEALLAHIPGLKVGLSSNPHDAYMMLRAAVADPDPTIVIESRAIYQQSGDVFLDAPVEAVRGAKVHRHGEDVVIISWGRMVSEAIAAAEDVSGSGIDAAVVDLRWLRPLDVETITEWAAKCRRVVVAHEANRTGGFGAEVAAVINETTFDRLHGPVRRVATPDVRMPAAASLQEALVPSRVAIASVVREIAGG